MAPHWLRFVLVFSVVSITYFIYRLTEITNTSSPHHLVVSITHRNFTLKTSPKIDIPHPTYPSSSVLLKIPSDHPYRPIIELDSRTNFLSPNVRNFLFRTQTLAFPTRYNAVFLDTLLEFDRIWRRQLGRSYMLIGGTLLGALRHGDKTPWDDDLDLVVDIKYNATVPRDLNGTKFSVTPGGPFRKLFFTHNGTTVNKYGHWPFIDLFFYDFRKNGEEMKIPPYSFVHKTKHVFPPSEVILMGRRFASPRCPMAFVLQTASRNGFAKCCSIGYNHRLDNSCGAACVQCSSLHRLFQFANYQRINETHTRQWLSKPTRGDETWTKGLAIRMPQC